MIAEPQRSSNAAGPPGCGMAPAILPAVISRVADPRTADRIVYELLRTPATGDPATRRATLAISDEAAGGRPLVRPHPPLPGDRSDEAPAHRTDCGWLV